MASVLFFLVMAMALGSAAHAGPEKVDICHFPPGNLSLVQLLQVGQKAAATHFSRHGDFEVLFPGSDINGVGCSFCFDSQDEACQVFCIGPPVCLCPPDDLEACCEANPCCDPCPEPKPAECSVITCGSEPPDCSVTVCSAPKPE